MLISIRHETRYRYESGNAGVTMRLRLWPISAGGLTVRDWVVTANGQTINGQALNSYGVPETMWRAPGRISEAVIVAEGVVETTDRAGIVGITDEPANPRVFLRQTPHTLPDDAMAALAREAQSADGALATLHTLSRIVHGRIAYFSGTTHSETSAAEALALGTGVCQDYAHVFIACARLLDLPARYVAGYVLEDGVDDAHQTHGWAEAWVQGLGWIAFDPTRKLCATDRYVRLSWGLDAYDCAPLRGLAHMAGAIALDVGVMVAPVEEMSHSQTQSQSQLRSQAQQ